MYDRITKDDIIKLYADMFDQQKQEIDKLKAEIYDLNEQNKKLKERNEKLSKRHPTKEEALAQYHWLKANSKRNK